MEKTKQRLAGDTHSGAGLLRRMAAAVVSVVLLVTGLSLHSVVNAETSLPVLETDVTQGTSDTTLVGIPGYVYPADQRGAGTDKQLPERGVRQRLSQSQHWRSADLLGLCADPVVG